MGVGATIGCVMDLWHHIELRHIQVSEVENELSASFSRSVL